MSFAILFLVTLLGVAAFFFLKRSPRPQAVESRPQAVATAQQEAYRCVVLVPGMDSCAGAQALAGSRLLASDAPVLPVEGCDVRCNCSYRRYSDRRSENRRRTDDGLSDDIIYSAEEKRGRDRRAT